MHVCAQASLKFLRILIKQCPVKSINLNFPSHTKIENVNPTIVNYVCYLWIQSIFSTLYLRKVFYHFPINPAVTPILDFQLLKRKCQAFCKGPLKKHSTYVCCKWFFILKYFFKIDTNVQLGQCWRLSLISNCINAKN